MKLVSRFDNQIRRSRRKRRRIFLTNEQQQQQQEQFSSFMACVAYLHFSCRREMNNDQGGVGEKGRNNSDESWWK